MNPFLRSALVIAFVVLIGFSFARMHNGSAHSNGAATIIVPVADKSEKSIVAGFDFSNIDRSANACQNFNQFANGGWMAKNPIPPAYSTWGRFTQLDEQNIGVLHDILEGLLKKKTAAPGNEQKIADFYRACMDEPTVEGAGIQPL